MDILNALFGKKKSGTGSTARVGKLYNEEQLFRAPESAMDADENRGAPDGLRLQPIEFVLDAKHPPPLRDFAKIVEEATAEPPLSAQPSTVVLFVDTRPSEAAAQVVNFVEKQGTSLPALPLSPPIELVLDPSHPLALREIMKFAAIEPTSTSPPTPQRRVQIVLDTRQTPPARKPEE
jgi:hypothetical protein